MGRENGFPKASGVGGTGDEVTASLGHRIKGHIIIPGRKCYGKSNLNPLCSLSFPRNLERFIISYIGTLVRPDYANLSPPITSTASVFPWAVSSLNPWPVFCFGVAAFPSPQLESRPSEKNSRSKQATDTTTWKGADSSGLGFPICKVRWCHWQEPFFGS